MSDRIPYNEFSNDMEEMVSIHTSNAAELLRGVRPILKNGKYVYEEVKDDGLPAQGVHQTVSQG